MRLRIVIVALTLISTPAFAKPITIGDGDAAYSISPETLKIEQDGVVLAQPSAQLYTVSDLTSDANSTSWKAAEQGLSFACRMTNDGAVELRISGEKGVTVHWPTVSIEANQQLVLPRDSGIRVSADDEFWTDQLVDETWDTLECLSMPIWGVLNSERCVSYMISTQFRNTVTFEKEENLTLNFSHEFHNKSPEHEITIRIVVDHNASPITPALRYREWLDNRGHVTTLAEKAEVVPEVNRLLGAPNVYLWGEAPISWHDIPRNQWNSFCTKLLNDSENEKALAAKLKTSFTQEQWDLVRQCTIEEWPYEYMKKQIVEGLSTALLSKTISADDLIKAYPDSFLPRKDWGGGVSLKMLQKIDEAGFDRMRLCVGGWEGIETRPWVAEETAKRGWLIGTYDSYHSIHNPATAGTDTTWPTAQMTAELWETVGIKNAKGETLTGFKKIGRKANPIAVRSYYEKRVSQILNATPFNYYFIDCDAFGEVYDDYNPLHENSMEEDAAARNDRLTWLAKNKKLVVGSEGGNTYAVEGCHLFEGLLGPHFGWSDKEMMNSDSEYFQGKHYPPDEPGIFFKSAQIKEKYRKLNYDPRVRIPLFQAAFHDAVMTTHHWSNGRNKHPEVKRDVELLELLWISPPMVHLNLDTAANRLPDLKKHFDEWSPLHRQLGFAKLTGFDYLTPDHKVQQTTWEDGTKIIVNFGDTGFSKDGVSVEGKEMIAIKQISNR